MRQHIVIVDEDVARDFIGTDEKAHHKAEQAIKYAVSEQIDTKRENEGTIVIAADPKQEPIVQEIRDDFVLVVDGECYVDSFQRWGNGTVQMTIKKGKEPSA